MINEAIVKFRLETFIPSGADLFHIARTTLTSGDDLRLHTHDYMEVFFVEHGEGVHHLNGEKFKIDRGYLCFMRENDAHTFAPTLNSTGITVTNIAFPCSVFLYFQQRYGSALNKYFDLSSNAPYSIYLSEIEISELKKKGIELTKGTKSNLELDNFLTSLILMLENRTPNKEELPHWLDFAIEEFKNPEKLRLGQEEFVKLTKMNKDHVNRTIKKYLGTTLTDYITDLRIQYAKHQLTMTNESIKAICYDCGYSSIQYFYKIFKSEFGLTPNDYRNQYHKIF